MDLIESALSEGRRTLSEYESKLVLSYYGIPIVQELLAGSESELESAINALGFPLAIKACAPNITHKTDLNLLKLNLQTKQEALDAFRFMTLELAKLGGGAVLVQKMARGQRELMVGMTRDPQFGPCVMFGLGGIFAEALEDVSFRVAPLENKDALEMMNEIRARKLLGAFRGMPPVDTERLGSILVNLGRLGMENDRVQEVDVNPLIIDEGSLVAVDALIALN
ncbi:MAG: acetate--CoA ligase family protein [Desulfomonilaceae bacterium]|jgi:acetyl-CoA synthetase (ADP-forming)